jgi:hypothetical protein
MSLSTYTHKEMMSKVFLTGMSAPQASPSANQKSFTFAGLLNKVLTDAGHEVNWASPSVYMTKDALEKYDAVLVGVSPLTSVGANRVYGALNVINELKDSDKLTLFIDTPSPSQIEPSLKSVISNPATLTKIFFSYRKEYSNVVADKDIFNRVLSGIKYLYENDWAPTIYSKLPWKSDIRICKNAKTNLIGINLDAHIIKELGLNPNRAPKWSVDSLSSPWAISAVAGLVLPNSLMKWNKGTTDAQVEEQISRSIGAIVSPDKKDGTYWNYRYIQAMNTRTPVITDWKESGVLDETWNLLGSSIESMSQEKRDLVATAQREVYLAKIPSKLEAVEILQNSIFRRNNAEN